MSRLIAALWWVGLAAGQTLLFDGKSLEGWKQTPFTGQGEVRVEEGTLVLGPGKPMTGITWTGSFPRSSYEVRFEAMRMQGNDFFASLTFPVGNSFATWVTGGWGGDIVGISSIDGWDASDNETRSYFNFENGRWYALRLEVTDDRSRPGSTSQPVVNVNIYGRTISLVMERSSYPRRSASPPTIRAGRLRKIEYGFGLAVESPVRAILPLQIIVRLL